MSLEVVVDVLNRLYLPHVGFHGVGWKRERPNLLFEPYAYATYSLLEHRGNELLQHVESRLRLGQDTFTDVFKVYFQHANISYLRNHLIVVVLLTGVSYEKRVKSFGLILQSIVFQELKVGALVLPVAH
jgi:hypothetical protein